MSVEERLQIVVKESGAAGGKGVAVFDNWRDVFLYAIKRLGREEVVRALGLEPDEPLRTDLKRVKNRSLVSGRTRRRNAQEKLRESQPMTGDRERCFHSVMQDDCLPCWKGHAKRVEAYISRLRAMVPPDELAEHDRYWLGANTPSQETDA